MYANLTDNSAAVARAFAEDPITLFDDLTQLLGDAGHDDLAAQMDRLLRSFDARLPRPQIGA